jgi:ubiquinone biosynthesis protein
MDQMGITRYLRLRRVRTAPEKSVNELMKLSVGSRFRMALEELGPAFIKLGQVVSTRPDIFPGDIIEELEKLQTSVPPFSFEAVREVIEGELNRKVEEVFASFEEIPIAAGSVAQVHGAMTLLGQKRVVKVQRPGIEAVIMTDLDILKDIAAFLDEHTDYGRFYHFERFVGELERTIGSELNFAKEGENADRLRANLKNDGRIKTPLIDWDLSGRRVLTMERIEGRSIHMYENQVSDPAKRGEIARRLTENLLKQLLRDGFYHADPHPGNIHILEDGTIVFLDLGMMGHLSERKKNALSKVVLGISLKNSVMVMEAVLSLDAMRGGADLRGLQNEIENLFEDYLTMSLEDIKLGEILSRFFSVSFSFGISIPKEFAMVGKALLTLEGIVERLDPALNILSIARPLTWDLAFHSFSPGNVLANLIGDVLGFKNMLRELPFFMNHWMLKMERSDFTMPWEMKHEKEILRSVERAINRIAFALILLALSILMAAFLIVGGLGSLSGGGLTLLWRVSIVIAAVVLLILSVSLIRRH